MVQPDRAAGRVRDVVEPVVDAAGLHLEDVQVSRAGRRSVVRVVVDLPEDELGSLGSDRLADVSRAVSAALDAADPVAGQYVLEVSTPGTDRPLTEPRHFRRARGRLVRLVLVDGGERTGRLREAEPDRLVLATDGGDVVVDPADVARGEVQVELRRADEDADEDAAEDEGEEA